MVVLWILVVLGAGAGGVVLGFTILGIITTPAPQVAASCSLAIALADVPYVFARAFQLADQSQKWSELLQAIQRLTSDSNFKSGIDSLFKQLEAIRVNTAQPVAATPATPLSTGRAVWATDGDSVPPATPSGMGYCPRCRQLRGMDVLKCVYCGETRSTVPS